MDRAVSLEARRIDLTVEPPFLLGPAKIDPPAHEISVGGHSARMQPQTMKVLVALHDKSGQVVTRNELADRCWDGRIVGEDVINRCISLLRRFAAGRAGFRIETVPRAGYRLVETRGGAGRRWLAIGGAAVLLVGLGGWYEAERPSTVALFCSGTALR
jgi:DNA-binding winged helix-turn-helix (wHTH) protein